MKRLFLLALIPIFSLVFSMPAVALSSIDIEESADIIKSFGGQWAKYKGQELIEAHTLYEEVRRSQEISWFSVGEKFKSMQRISDAKDRLKAVHDQTKAYEEQVQWGQVKDTGMELYQFAMGGLGLVGQFNKDVKAFHEMMGATERMVRDANELRKVPFWKFWESGPKTKDLLYSGLNFKRTWERFRTTGGGKIVDKVITFAKKFIKVSGSSYNPVSTTPTGATPPLVQNTVQVVTDILRGSSSNNDTSSVSSDQAKTYKAMRESAYRRLTEAMQNGDSPELLKMHKEEFDIIDARYREAIGR